jgi:hypothetical protein
MADKFKTVSLDTMIDKHIGKNQCNDKKNYA